MGNGKYSQDELQVRLKSLYDELVDLDPTDTRKLEIEEEMKSIREQMEGGN